MKNVVERWVGNTKDQVKREIEIRKDRVAESGANARSPSRGRFGSGD